MDAVLGYPAIDMDNHYYEPLDCFSRHIEPAYRDLAIVAKSPDESSPPLWTMGDRQVTFLHVTSVAVPPPGYLAEMLSGGANVEFREVINPHDYPEFMERKSRLDVLDRQGVESALMISTAALDCEYDFRDRPQALCANYRSFNRWVEEEWGFGSDGRIFGVPLVTLLDVDWAVEEIERLAERSSRFVFVKIGPVNGRSPADPIFDPFWSRVQEFGMKPVFHIGYEGFAHMYGVHWGEDPNRTLFTYSPYQHYLCFGERPIADHMAALVLHNFFGRFPGIDVLSIENGSAWVAPLLKSMDKAAHLGALGEQFAGRLEALPSETFRQHVYIAPFHEEDVPALVEVIGSEHILFGSDYPHPEGLAEPLDFLKGLAGLSDRDVRNIMRDNAARLIGT